MGQVFLALGSNLGNRLNHLQTGLGELEMLGCTIFRESPVYETPPMYYLDQNKFLNQVVEMVTSMTPMELLVAAKQVERTNGRIEKTFRNGPRTLDIDILCFDALTLSERLLVIPHPKIAERRFVLQPWNDIAPGYIVPGLNKTVAQLLTDTSDCSKIYRYHTDLISEIQ